MDPSSFVLFFVLLVLLAFFAGTEIPLMSVSAHKLETFRKLGRIGAKSLEVIRKDPERLLIVNLIGTTIVTIAISSLSTVVAIEAASGFGLTGDQAVAAAIFFASAIILLFGEIAPKIVCVRFADATVLLVAPIYRFLLFVCSPINFLIRFFVRFIGFFTGGTAGIHSPKMSQEELEAFIDFSREEGAVDGGEHKKIKGVLDLSETEASSAMTPRVKVDFIPMDCTIDQSIDIFLASSHTRLPVSGEDTDDVDYVVTLREALAWQKRGIGATKLADLDLEKIIKVPLTKPLDQIFETFQKSRKHIALVMDEYGGVAGVITLEDIVEEVFGDIKDEKDREEVYIRRRGDGSLHVKGDVILEDALEHFGKLDLERYGIEEYEGETVSYLIIAYLESFPENSERIMIGTKDDGFEFTVEKVDDNAIEDVRIVRFKKEELQKKSKK
jgi:CBS domain containing-hemolysin-like protein